MFRVVVSSLLLLGLLEIALPRSISVFQSGDWDHYIFVQQYPAGFCAYNNSKGIRCGYPSNASDWTIHGLWPTMGDTKGPNFCNTTAKFQADAISDLVSKLRVEWTDLFNSTPYYTFWEHEWLKHGTCSSYPDEHSFFEAVLNLHDNMRLGQILSQSGILPSKSSLDVKSLWNAFRDNLGAYPYEVDCKYYHGVQYLVQVGMCLDSNSLKIIQCPSDPAGSCRLEEPIIYAPSIYV